MRERVIDRLQGFVQGRAFTRINYSEVRVQDIPELYQVAAKHLLGREFTAIEAKFMQDALQATRGQTVDNTPVSFKGKFSPPFFIHELGPVNGKNVKITSLIDSMNSEDGTASVLLFEARK